jgi:hypothetical protein
MANKLITVSDGSDLALRGDRNPPASPLPPDEPYSDLDAADVQGAGLSRTVPVDALASRLIRLALQRWVVLRRSELNAATAVEVGRLRSIPVFGRIGLLLIQAIASRLSVKLWPNCPAS